MTTDPISAAHILFTESLASLMAHTIRGTQNLFRKHQLDLEILIVADVVGVIRLQDPRDGATSVLQTRLVNPRPNSPAVGLVQARIYIHKDANRNLARICIAHEIFHLLLEFSGYLNSTPRVWKKVHTNKEIEDKCNQFAWELCKSHDNFNRDEATRDDILYFPGHLFDKPLSTDANHQENWPLGIALDPSKAFHLKPDASKWLPSRTG